MAQVKRALETLDTEGATHKHSRTEEDDNEGSGTDEGSTSSQHPSSAAKLVETSIKDVYTSDIAVSPETLKNNLEDWNSPVIIIIAKHTRDRFLASLDSITSSTADKAPKVHLGYSVPTVTATPYHSKKSVIRRTDRQTDRPTKNITSFIICLRITNYNVIRITSYDAWHRGKFNHMLHCSFM